MRRFSTEKELRKHLKRRVGGEFTGASKELREIFGVGHLSFFGKEKASKMSLHLNWEIKLMIKRREITSIEQIDKIVDEKFATLRKVMKSPPLNIKIYKPSSKVTVSAHRGVKKAGGALAGGLLLGPVGAIAGYGLASGDGSTTKEQIINNNQEFKEARLVVYPDCLKIYDRMARYQNTIPFSEVDSIGWNSPGRSFKITTNDNDSIVVSTNDTSLTYLFDELMFQFNNTPKLCTNCGSKLKENTNFCGECGQKIP